MLIQSFPAVISYPADQILLVRNLLNPLLFGEGGARTRYARQVGSSTWSGGEEIRPLTIDEAREWAEKHLSADEYETIFGPVSEDDAPGKMMVTICIRRTV